MRSGRVWSSAIALLAATSVFAQSPSQAAATTKQAGNAYRYRLLGVYDEQSGDPLEGVEITDVFNRTKSSTTKTGTVSLFFLPDGGAVVSIRKLGYEPQQMTVAISPADTTPITVILKRATQQLPTVVVNDAAIKAPSSMMRGFEERKARGFGHFVDDSVFRANDNHELADLLPTHLPGLQISLGDRTTHLVSGRKQCQGFALLGNLKGANNTSTNCKPGDPPSCYVALYIDGVHVYDPTMDKSAIPDFARMPASEYAGAEFYQGAAIPAEFNSSFNSDCGVLLLWTRIK